VSVALDLLPVTLSNRSTRRPADHRTGRGVSRNGRALHPAARCPTTHPLRQARQVRPAAAVSARRVHRGRQSPKRVATGGSDPIPRRLLREMGWHSRRASQPQSPRPATRTGPCHPFPGSCRASPPVGSCN